MARTWVRTAGRVANRNRSGYPIAGEAHLTALGPIEPGQDVDERRLPRSVRPDHAVNGAGPDLHRQTIEGDEPAEYLAQARDLDQRPATARHLPACNRLLQTLDIGRGQAVLRAHPLPAPALEESGDALGQ